MKSITRVIKTNRGSNYLFILKEKNKVYGVIEIDNAKDYWYPSITVKTPHTLDYTRVKKDQIDILAELYSKNLI